MELDLQVNPEEIMNREVKKVGLLSLRVVPQQQCNGHCPCDSTQARQLKQQLRSALVSGQWRGDTALSLPLFWRRSTVSPVFFGRYPRSSLHTLALCPKERYQYTTSVDIKITCYKRIQSLIQNHMRHVHRESAREQRIELYKSYEQ